MPHAVLAIEAYSMLKAVSNHERAHPGRRSMRRLGDKAPLYPFEVAHVKALGTTDPIEALLTRRAVRTIYARPVEFRDWLLAQAERNDPVGDIASDAAREVDPWSTPRELRALACPPLAEQPDEIDCPDMQRVAATKALDAAEREWLLANGQPVVTTLTREETDEND